MGLDLAAIRARLAAQIAWAPPLHKDMPTTDLDTLIGEVGALEERVARHCRRFLECQYILVTQQQRIIAFGGQLQSWGFDAAAQELYKEILDGDMHTPDYDKLVAIAAAADRWATAISEPNGVHAAERVLVQAVEAWRAEAERSRP